MPNRPFIPKWYREPEFIARNSAHRKEHTRKHAAKRAKERYTVDLTPEEIAQYSLAIETDTYGENVEFLRRKTGHSSIWKITHNGQVLYALYLNRHHCITTFLPPEAVDAREIDAQEADHGEAR